MDDPASLDIPPERMRAMLDAVAERVLEHLATLSEQPHHGDMQGVEALCHSLREPAPRTGEPLEAVIAPLFDDWLKRSFNAPGPGYLAFIPGGGIFPSALADFFADAVNRYTGVWNAAPALVQLEANVLEWMAEWMGYPSEARGLLTSGGSMATFAAVVSARESKLGTALRDGVLYTSTQAHHCVAKAAQLAGILPDRQRLIAVDRAMRMDVAALEQAIAQDRAAGLQPFMVVSAAGTTNTGAVDPLEAIGALCRRERLWHHVDAAYGGFFHMVDELRPRLAGMSESDSITLDPHKGLFLPYGTGAVLVRDGEVLRRAHAVDAGYLPTLPDGVYSPSQYGPELSRPYRGLRVWLPLKVFGSAKFEAALLEKRQLAVEACNQVAAIEGIDIVAPPDLSLFAFTLGWPGSSLEEQNGATRQLMEGVTARGRVMITGAQVGERFLGRVCVLCFRTRREHVQQCVEDLRLEAARIRAEHGH